MKVRLISIALTFALSILITSALVIVLYGGRLGHSLAALIHGGRAFAVAWKILQWPIALAFVFITFALIYHFAPDLAAKRRARRLAASDYRRRWVSPGVLVAVALWAGVARVPSLSAFFQFVQCDVWLAGRGYQSDAVVLSYRGGNSFGRRNQLRAGE